MMLDLKLRRTLAIGIIVVSLTVSVGTALAAPRQDRSTLDVPTTESSNPGKPASIGPTRPFTVPFSTLEPPHLRP
jgi:hypothetical protein